MKDVFMLTMDALKLLTTSCATTKRLPVALLLSLNPALMFTLAAASETWWDPLIHWLWTFVLWHVIQVTTESLVHTLQVGKLSDALKARHDKMLTVYWAEHEILWYKFRIHEKIMRIMGTISSKILPTYFTKKHPKHVQNSSEDFRPDLRRFGTRLLRVSWAPRTCQPAMFDGLMAWETDSVPADNLSDHIETYDDMW